LSATPESRLAGNDEDECRLRSRSMELMRPVRDACAELLLG
jgi:hypothetical protein